MQSEKHKILMCQHKQQENRKDADLHSTLVVTKMKCTVCHPCIIVFRTFSSVSLKLLVTISQMYQTHTKHHVRTS